MAWSPCPWKRFPGTRQPDHRLPAFSHGSRVVVVAARLTRRIVRFTPTTARETRLVHRTHHLPRGYSPSCSRYPNKTRARALSYLPFLDFLLFNLFPFRLFSRSTHSLSRSRSLSLSLSLSLDLSRSLSFSQIPVILDISLSFVMTPLSDFSFKYPG